jgi:hypothetical protein
MIVDCNANDIINIITLNAIALCICDLKVESDLDEDDLDLDLDFPLLLFFDNLEDMIDYCFIIYIIFIICISRYL